METLSNYYYANDELKEIMENSKDNQICFDCGKNPSSFASINLGIFLCYSCSQFHKRLGNKISEIRSLYIDSWTEEQLKYLKSGGNTRLNLLLRLYDITKEKIQKVILYNSKVIEYHIQTISSEVHHNNLPIMPDIEEGLCLFNGADTALVNKILEEQRKVKTFFYKGQKVFEDIQEKIDTSAKKFHQDVYHFFVVDIAGGIKDKCKETYQKIEKSIGSTCVTLYRP